MRVFALAFLSVLLSLPFSGKSQPQLYDVSRYKFSILLSDKTDSIFGEAEISLKLLEPASSIVLDFSTASAKDKGMTVMSCSLNDEPVRFSLTGDHEKLELHPAKPMASGARAQITVVYQGIPTDGLIISKNKYGHRSFFADNWPNRGHKWLPCSDHPGDKAKVEFNVMAPAHYRVVANGLLKQESAWKDGLNKTVWRENIPIATKVMVIGVADFAVDTAGYVQDSIPVFSWVYPEDREKGFYDYGQAKDIMPFFISYVGPYGYKKLANVQSKTIFGGLENANTIFYAENTITGTRKTESLLAHEIAHQWFGNMASEKTFAHLWLSEGFATYMTILYMENKYGRDTALHMLKEDRQQVIKSPVTQKRSVVDETTDYMALLNTNSYQKGGWILHMLRKELGDTVFHKSIRDYYSKYANGNADTRDLQKVFETVSGKNLGAFFDQWLYSPGIPKIEVKWFNAMKTGTTVVEVRQLQEKGFVFPLTLKFTDATGKTVKKTINVINRYTQVEFDNGFKAEKIELDPETSLLFSGSVTVLLTK